MSFPNGVTVTHYRCSWINLLLRDEIQLPTCLTMKIILSGKKTLPGKWRKEKFFSCIFAEEWTLRRKGKNCAELCGHCGLSSAEIAHCRVLMLDWCQIVLWCNNDFGFWRNFYPENYFYCNSYAVPMFRHLLRFRTNFWGNRQVKLKHRANRKTFKIQRVKFKFYTTRPPNADVPKSQFG